MSRVMKLSLALYRGVTALYLNELRCNFGEEMLETFAEDLVTQKATRGIRGVLAVWRIALSEVIRLAPRLWFRNISIAAPALAALAMIATASPALVQAIQRQAQGSLRPGETTLLDTVMALALDGMVAALTAFVTVKRLNNQRLIGLPSLRERE